MLFCHATPRNEDEGFLETTAEEKIRPLFDGLGAALVVCGHTHMQFDRIVGTTRIVNAGSVGQPFGEPDAYWLLVGPDVELRRTAYDLEAAAVEFAPRRIRGPRSLRRRMSCGRRRNSRCWRCFRNSNSMRERDELTT